MQTSIASASPGIVDMSPPMTFRAKSNFFCKPKNGQFTNLYQLHGYVWCQHAVYMEWTQACESKIVHLQWPS